MHFDAEDVLMILDNLVYHGMRVFLFFSSKPCRTAKSICFRLLTLCFFNLMISAHII